MERGFADITGYNRHCTNAQRNERYSQTLNIHIIHTPTKSKGVTLCGSTEGWGEVSRDKKGYK